MDLIRVYKIDRMHSSHLARVGREGDGDGEAGRAVSEHRTALVWQLALAAYMQLMAWVPLGRWNYQPCCPSGLEQLRRGTLSAGDVVPLVVFVLPAALFWLGVRRNWRWAMAVAVLATFIWLGLQIWSWWIPYAFGASEQWARVYARNFANSTAVLPRSGNHLPPDGLHLVLQILLMGTVVTGARAIFRYGRSR